ncbi:MAG: CoA pyrophosphatase, partial [Planctomycetota bacterium]
MNLDSIDKEFIKRSLANPDGSRPDSNVTHSVFRRTLDRPRSRPEKLPGVGKIGAVLVLFYCGPNEELQFLLTKRSSRLNHHAGQISLPGGRRDPNESIEQTAIRETVEEVNASQTQIELLGRLEPVYIPPSDFTVHPMVAWYDPPIQFVAAEDEVEEILEVRFELIAR